MRIIPAILTNNKKELLKMLQEIAGVCDYAQIDIMDSKFVPSKSVAIKDLASVENKNNINIKKEIHLMTAHPLKEVEKLVKENIKNIKQIIFHIECSDNILEVIKLIKKYKIKPALAINPDTRLEKILPYVDLVDEVLFLGVHPGFYGAKFLPKVWLKIKKFKKLFPDKNISLDGGVGEKRIAKARELGLNSVVIGSTIFTSVDPAAMFLKLQKNAKIKK